MKVEYRVRPVTRYVVTRWHESDEGRTGGSESKGEYDSFEMAYEVAYALAKDEHDRLGYPPGDERVRYPNKFVSETSKFTYVAGGALSTAAV
jgi:hypothetical protein